MVTTVGKLGGAAKVACLKGAEVAELPHVVAAGVHGGDKSPNCRTSWLRETENTASVLEARGM
jgi:hypothetical protein